MDHLDYLTRLDLSKVVLDQLYPSSKCVLARYLQKQQRSNPAMIILPPQAEYCDCVYDFILNMLKKKPEHAYADLCQNNQHERCQLSECDIVKTFRLPVVGNRMNPAAIPSIDESFHHAPPLPFDPILDRTTTPTRHLPALMPRQPFDPSKSHMQERIGGHDSSFAETQVIIIQPRHSSSPRPYFVVRKRTRKGKKPTRKQDLLQTHPPFSYDGPHW